MPSSWPPIPRVKDWAPVFAPKLGVNQAGGQVTLSWSLAIWMKNSVLKSTPSLQSPSWTEVPGVRAEGIDN